MTGSLRIDDRETLHERVLRETRSYIQENLLYMRRDYVLDDQASLIAEGIVDSMGVLELLQFIEDRFAVTIGDHDTTEENLGSLRAIASFVIARRHAIRQSL